MDIPDYSERLAASVQAVLDAVERGLIPGGQYDAVLVDEAHDFEPQWLALAAKMVNPDTKALMIVYDDAQAIYKGRKRPVWKQLGIEAAGRTTVLKVNYRNTAPILRFARKFAADVIGAPGVCAGDENAILMPEDGGREGVEPVVRQCVSHDGEAHAIAEWLLGRKAAGYQWGQMAVLYPRHFIGERFEKILAKHGVPVDVAKEHGNRVQAERDAVRFLSMHNAKGLEFPCVAIGGLGELKKPEDIEDDVRLTYVAITRATHEAFVTYSNMSELVGRLVV
jgi:superfamily I DNA/RNA helicase